MSETIQGLDKVIKKLNSLDDKVERQIIGKGMREGCKIWKAAAIQEAPKRSGLMASKIKVRSGGSSRKGKKVQVRVDQKDFQGEAWYAAAVIYGHHVGKRSLGNKRKFVQPNNFLLRAFNSAKARVVDTAVAKWFELIEDASK